MPAKVIVNTQIMLNTNGTGNTVLVVASILVTQLVRLRASAF